MDNNKVKMVNKFEFGKLNNNSVAPSNSLMQKVITIDKKYNDIKIVHSKNKSDFVNRIMLQYKKSSN